jgi:hypothetical protein
MTPSDDDSDETLATVRDIAAGVLDARTADTPAARQAAEDAVGDAVDDWHRRQG